MKNTLAKFVVLMFIVVLSFAVVGLTACDTVTPVVPAPDAPSYTVTFDAQGGTAFSPVTAASVTLPTPERAGHIFQGWFTTDTFDGTAVVSPFAPTADTTLHAKWQAISGKVTFVSNGGTEYAPVSFSGEAVVLPTPEKADHTFLGWYASADFSGEKLGETYLAEGNITLYAQWEYSAQIIEFDAAGGTQCASIPADGQEVTLPATTRYGYEFLGWYLSADAEAPVTDPFSATQSVTLIAKWKQLTYVYLYYGTSTDFERVVGEPGQVLDTAAFFTPDPLMVEHYVTDYTCPFNGWVYEDKASYDGIGEAVPATITLGDEHLVLLATYDYSGVPAYDRLTDNGDGSFTVAGNTDVEFYKTTDGLGKMTFDVTVVKGSTLATSIAFRMNQTDGDNEYWTKGSNYLDVTLVGNGTYQFNKLVAGTRTYLRSTLVLASLPQTFQDKYNATEDGAPFTVTLSVANYADHFDIFADGEMIFTYGLGAGEAEVLSAFTGTNFGMRASQKGSIYSNIHFEPISTYTLLDGEDTVETSFHFKGESITATLVDSDVYADGDGYAYDKFMGWSETVDGAITATYGDATTLYAVYEKVTVYQVAFDADNGTQPSLSYYHAGETVVLPTAPEKNGIVEGSTHIGYIFAGWIIAGTEDAVTASTVVTASINVVAVYTESNAYSVTYISNMEGITIEEAVVAEGEIFTLPAPTKDGYRLVGWYTDSTCNTLYTPTPITASFSLFGRWVETTTVTFVVGEETLSTQTIDKGTVASLPTAPTKDSITHENGNISTFTFAGWYADAVEVTASTTFENETIVVAQFTEVVSRNGVIFTTEGGDNIYTFPAGRPTAQHGVVIPGLALTEGDLSYTISVGGMPTAETNIRVMFYVDEANNVNVTGTGTQSTVWINLNLFSGSVIFGQKIYGQTGNTFEVGFAKMASCDYKTKYNAIKAGETPFVLSFRVVLGGNSVKFYIENCLIFAYGDISLYDSEAKTYGGEALYGAHFDPADTRDLNANLLYPYLNGETINKGSAAGKILTKGDQIGFQMWQDLASRGVEYVAISDVVIREAQTVTYIYDDSIVEKVLPGTTVTKTIADTAIVDDGNGNYSYDRFIGWYDAPEGGNQVTSIESSITLYARFESVTVYQVSIDTDNGDPISTAYYHEGDTIILPAEPIKNGGEEDGILVGYSFAGWVVAGTQEQVTSETVVTANLAIEAVYNQSLAYVVSYSTGKDGVNVDNSIVADGDILSLPTAPVCDGYRFDTWCTDQELLTPYVEGAVNSSFTLYARWVLQVTVTFQNGEETVDTQIIDQGGTVTLPAGSTKGDYTHENGNISSYVFASWVAHETPVTAATTFEADTIVAATYTETLMRNGAVVTQDENGDVYTLTGNRSTTQGISLPGVHLTAGEVALTLTMENAFPANAGFRLLILTEDDGKLILDGTGNQSNLWLHFNPYSGGIALGTKVHGVSENGLYESTLANIQSCSFKTKLTEAKAAGTGYSVRLRVRFSDTYIKFYIDDCLVVVYGDESCYAGETLYGFTCDPARATGSVDASKQFTPYFLGTPVTNSKVAGEVVPKGDLVGIQMWQNLTSVYTVSDIDIIPEYALTYKNGSETVGTQKVVPGTPVTKTLADTAIVDDGNGNYSYGSFIGWYDALEGGNQVNVIGAHTELFARFETVIVYQVSIDTANGDPVSNAYYHDGETIILPTEPTKAGTEEAGALTGYTFSKWVIAGTEEEVNSETVIHANLSIQAVYTEQNAYRVTYVTNCEASLDPYIVAEGEALPTATVARDGYRFDAWCTDQELLTPYVEGAVNSSFTLYARWIQLVTVTFMDGTTQLDVQVIDQGATATFPATDKDDYTHENGNLSTYTFTEWQVAGSAIADTATFDVDTIVNAIYAETLSRNGVLITKDASDHDVYTFPAGRPTSQQGIVIPDLALSEGEFTYNVSWSGTTTNNTNFRVMFYSDESDNVNVTGTGTQKTVWVNFNLHSGGLILGQKIYGQTGNTFSLAFGSIKACDFKTKYNAIKAGTAAQSIDFRVVLGGNTIKFYAEDCLLFVYGEESIYEGETLYGLYCDPASTADLNANLLYPYLNGETINKGNASGKVLTIGDQIGFQMWENLANLGVQSVSVSNIVVTPASEE